MENQKLITIRVTEDEIQWAVKFINAFIASKSVNTEPNAHRFVSALTNRVRTEEDS